MKIAHLILGLGSGGAEKMLLKLAIENSKNIEVSQVILTITNNDFLLPDFQKNNICVHKLNGSSWYSFIFIFPKLLLFLYKFQPTILQCWMYHSELVGLLSKIFYWKKMKLFWNIRCSGLDWKNRSFLNKIMFTILVRFSNVPSAIISNTKEGIDNHINEGYEPSKMIKIDNGFVIKDVIKANTSKISFFKKHKIPLDSKTIVMVARFNYVKDHNTLVKAFDRLLEDSEFKDTKLVLIGNDENTSIKENILSSKNRKSIYILGNISNVVDVVHYFDIGVLTSLNEGFPNVIGEYILSNLIVVATNVGEIKSIIKQDKPFLVEKSDYLMLSDYFKTAFKLSEDKRNKILIENKNYVIDNFSINKISKKYLDLYDE